jgi:hypothetical protein
VHKSTTARLALLALVWGSSFLWIKLSLRGLSPVEVTFGRLILGATTPLWTLVVAMVTRHERTVTPARLAGLVIGFGGALLIFSPWRPGSDLVSAGGLECLGAAVSYGVAFVYMDRFIARSGISPVALSAGCCSRRASWRPGSASGSRSRFRSAVSGCRSAVCKLVDAVADTEYDVHDHPEQDDDRRAEALPNIAGVVERDCVMLHAVGVRLE